ncbi:unnamed protein product [Urochloa humidicola]
MTVALGDSSPSWLPALHGASAMDWLQLDWIHPCVLRSWNCNFLAIRLIWVCFHYESRVVLCQPLAEAYWLSVAC